MQVSARFHIQLNKLIEINFQNEKKCEFPITGLENVSGLETYRSEKFGPDFTVYPYGQSGTLKFNTGIDF